MKAQRSVLSTQLPLALAGRLFNLQHSTKSSVLPFDIIAQIIDILLVLLVENKETNLLKELALRLSPIPSSRSVAFIYYCRTSSRIIKDGIRQAT